MTSLYGIFLSVYTVHSDSYEVNSSLYIVHLSIIFMNYNIRNYRPDIMIRGHHGQRVISSNNDTI